MQSVNSCAARAARCLAIQNTENGTMETSKVETSTYLEGMRRRYAATIDRRLRGAKAGVGAKGSWQESLRLLGRRTKNALAGEREVPHVGGAVAPRQGLDPPDQVGQRFGLGVVEFENR